MGDLWGLGERAALSIGLLASSQSLRARRSPASKGRTEEKSNIHQVGPPPPCVDGAKPALY